MITTQQDVEQAVRSFVQRIKHTDDLDLNASLYADGVGLDSLETAELSAVLEDEFGSDPFTSEEMPRTAAEIISFYAPE